jgi:hypothetical protein
VPDVAIPMQHSLLKRISAFQTKEVSAQVACAAVYLQLAVPPTLHTSPCICMHPVQKLLK